MWLEVIPNGEKFQPACSEPTTRVSALPNLRHSASFSCLPRNSLSISERACRARTATLSALDLDYGFVVRPAKGVPQLPRTNHPCCDSLDAAESVISSDLDTSKSERPNLLKNALLKKSVNLLNPNVWWTPKFRRVKSGKSKEKNAQEVQTQKRWRSLGALLKVSSSNSSRSLDTAQSSLPAQSFYLLDDFLKPNHSASSEGRSLLSRNNSSTSNPADSARTVVSPPSSKPAELRNSSEEKADVKERYNESSDLGSSNVRYCGRESIPATKNIKINGKTITPKMKNGKHWPELLILQPGATYSSHSYKCTGNNHGGSGGGGGTICVNGVGKEPVPSKLPSSVSAQHQQTTTNSNLNDKNLCPRLTKFNKSRSRRRRISGDGECADGKMIDDEFAALVYEWGMSSNEGGRKISSAGREYRTKTDEEIAASLNGREKRTPSRMSSNNGSRKLPITAEEALKHFGSFLTNYEKKEITSYSEIWYVGWDAYKMRGDGDQSMNFGYDDENGNYYKVWKDHLSYRYEVLDNLGTGNFGQVVKAFDHKTKSYVAIKIIRNKKRFHHQAQVELVILNDLRQKDSDGSHNVIHMLDYFYFRHHLCIIFELLDMNLYKVIKRNGYRGFNVSLVKKYAFSLVQCLRLLYREKIIHCDLKPENILLKKENSHEIKVIDFGSSCYAYQKVYTYIQSRFYRSPEIILGLPYDCAIDMWSLGCILAELHTGFPLFPGENEVEQLACIMEVIGLPPYEMLLRATRRKYFFDAKGTPRCLFNSRMRRRKPGSRDLAEALKSNNPLAEALKNDNSLFVDFISRCLEWDPEKRLSPDGALKHSWLKDLVTDSASVQGKQKTCKLFPLKR